MRPGAIVQCSGGIESTVGLALAIERYGRDNVWPIAFDTDSIFWKMRDQIAVKRVCTNLQIQDKLIVCRMPQVDLLEYRRNDKYQDVGFIPGFKMLFNTASMAFAQRLGVTSVWIGNMGDNVFPDEEPQHLTTLEDEFNRVYLEGEGINERIKIVTPFTGFTKWQIINLGSNLGVDLYDTVSCGDERVAGGFNCGVCPWCEKRRAGFQDSTVPDKTRYLFL